MSSLAQTKLELSNYARGYPVVAPAHRAPPNTINSTQLVMAPPDHQEISMYHINQAHNSADLDKTLQS